MDWTVYLLMASGQLHVSFCILSGVGFACMVGGFMAADMNGFQKEYHPTLKRIGVISVVLMLVASLMPAPSALIRAYVMVEGAKVVNAPNAEKAITEFTKRVDRIIKVIEKK